MLLDLQHWQTSWSRALHTERNWNWVTISKPRSLLFPKTAAQGFNLLGLCCSTSTGWILPFTFSILICFFSERSFQWETLAWLLFIVKMMAKISLTKISSQKQCCCQTLQTNYVAKCSTPEYNGHSLTESKILSLVLKMAGIILNRKTEGSNSFGLSLHGQMFQESSRDPYSGKRHVQ